MTKQEIIKLLDKEIGLFHATEDEDSLGELYLTDLEFRKVEYLFKELEKKNQDAEAHLQDLREMIEKGGGFTVLRDMKDGRLQNKEIHFEGHIILMDSPYFRLDNNNFYSKTNDQKEN